MTNPFESPVDTPEQPSFATRIALPTVVTAMAVIVGGFVVLLQNGQVFTNGLICLCLFGFGGVVWALLAVYSPAVRGLALSIALAHVVVMVALAITLPSKWAFEKNFKTKMEEARMRRLR
jgi:lipopolysaccharide export LptBFGC system permease protein LptF